ncbi:MAG: NAD-dependent epimerase [Woeseiaceae bacterium]|nr:NAD-dependent epimerase [Woeseiaceae bacterium]
MKVMVTGAAGFIGMFTARYLLERGDEVIGVDNFNDYYDVSLKKSRAAILENYEQFRMVRLDLADRDGVEKLFNSERFDKVVHLAAQAGVRYSLENPHSYVDSNVVGTLHILEGCRHNEVEHLVYASSSSVYGANTSMPFSTRHNVDHPLALYGATKKACELMAHAYSNLYGLPTTGLRFFTVYGPWGRPDMAPIRFAKNISEGKPIDVYNYGNHRRDFTYIDDIVEGVVRTLDHVAAPDPAWDSAAPDASGSRAPYRIYNIGNQKPVDLMRFIELIEENLGKTAEKNMLPMQPGDVPDTWADTSDLSADVGYQPSTPIDVGVKKFVDWYLNYYSNDLKQSA